MKILSQLAMSACLLSMAACTHIADGTGDGAIDLSPGASGVRVVAFTHVREQVLVDSVLEPDVDGGLSVVSGDGGLTARWRDTGWGGLRLEANGDTGLEAVREGHLALTLAVEEWSSTGVEIGLFDTGGKMRSQTLDPQLQSLAGRGVQTVKVPMSCLMRATDDAAEMRAQLRLALGGSGQINLSRVVIYPEPAAGDLVPLILAMTGGSE